MWANTLIISLVLAPYGLPKRNLSVGQCPVYLKQIIIMMIIIIIIIIILLGSGSGIQCHSSFGICPSLFISGLTSNSFSETLCSVSHF